MNSLEEFCQALETRGSAQLARAMQQVVAVKRDLDQRMEKKDLSVFQIDDVDQLASAVCDGMRIKIDELANLEDQLPEVLASRDSQRFTDYMNAWRQGNEQLLRAHAAIHRAATGSGPENLTDRPQDDSEESQLRDAVEALLLEVRTAERIRNELGALALRHFSAELQWVDVPTNDSFSGNTQRTTRAVRRSSAQSCLV